MPKREDWVPAEMPEGSNPEEFLNDEAMVAHLQAKADSLEGDEKAEALAKVKRAKLAAAITAAAADNA